MSYSYFKTLFARDITFLYRIAGKSRDLHGLLCCACETKFILRRELSYRRSLIRILRGRADLRKTSVDVIFELFEVVARLFVTVSYTHSVYPRVVLAVHLAVPITVLHDTDKVMSVVHIGNNAEVSGRGLIGGTMATFVWRG